jgi:hypothetical protein
MSIGLVAIFFQCYKLACFRHAKGIDLVMLIGKNLGAEDETQNKSYFH